MWQFLDSWSQNQQNPLTLQPFIPYTTFLGLKQCTRTDEQAAAASKIAMMESNIIAACNEKMEESNNLLRQMAITLQQASQK